MKPLSVYVNFPFCRQKCHFCDWVQRIPKQDLFLKHDNAIRQAYVTSLCHEIRTKGKALASQGYSPTVMYWGGGTATTMTEEEVVAVYQALDDVFDMSTLEESTIEGSPDTISLEQLKHYHSLGFDRVSVGLQSFDPTRLKRLGRRHTREQGIDVIANAMNAGFEKISVDLMCGFPGESLAEIKQNIDEATKLGVKQLSLYTFRPTEGTMMRRAIDKYGQVPTPEQQLKAYYAGSHLLREAGFEEYGVGYFGDEAKNVTAMFQLECDVIGFGSGAVSIVDQAYCGHTSGKLHDYIDSPLTYDYQSHAVSSPGVMLSFLRSGLSMYAGITKAHWHERLGEMFEESYARSEIAELVDLFSKVAGLDKDASVLALDRQKAPLAIIGLMNGSMLTTKTAA